MGFESVHPVGVKCWRSFVGLRFCSRTFQCLSQSSQNIFGKRNKCNIHISRKASDWVDCWPLPTHQRQGQRHPEQSERLGDRAQRPAIYPESLETHHHRQYRHDEDCKCSAAIKWANPIVRLSSRENENSVLVIMAESAFPPSDLKEKRTPKTASGSN